LGSVAACQLLLIGALATHPTKVVIAARPDSTKRRTSVVNQAHPMSSLAKWWAALENLMPV
jgi:hypothetical protein